MVTLAHTHTRNTRIFLALATYHVVHAGRLVIDEIYNMYGSQGRQYSFSHAMNY